LLGDPDKAKAERVMNAMMKMTRIDIAAPKEAAARIVTANVGSACWTRKNVPPRLGGRCHSSVTTLARLSWPVL
jgi:hypothetical protein